MILILFGQSGSGKTTLSKEIQRQFFYTDGVKYPIVDGDDVRSMFQNTDYSPAGRIKNMERISDISFFLSTKYEMVIVSAMYPYKCMRDYILKLSDEIVWVHLDYHGTRGKEKYHVKDFDSPYELRNLYCLHTSDYDISECVSRIIFHYMWANRINHSVVKMN